MPPAALAPPPQFPPAATQDIQPPATSVSPPRFLNLPRRHVVVALAFGQCTAICVNRLQVHCELLSTVRTRAARACMPGQT